MATTDKTLKAAAAAAAAKKAKDVSKKKIHSSVGAPSQHNQSSRKGKRAWRKNVDIEDVEDALEGMRAEERVVGTALQKMTNNDLFQIDVKGDDKIRKSLPRYTKSQLTATKILSQRSAVPAVFSRSSSTSTSTKRKSILSHEEKNRYLRISKRPRRGPFNSIVDHTEPGAGSIPNELSEAVKSSGKYDLWAPEPEPEELPAGLETVQKKRVKNPALPHPRDVIAVPAVLEPHQGMSYNPPADAHQELILKAYEMEEKRIRDEEKLAEVKKKMEEAEINMAQEDPTTAPGMQLDRIVLEEKSDIEEDTIPVKRLPERKTKAQRNKAAKLLAQKRALAEEAARKQMLASIPSAKSLRLSLTREASSRQKKLAEKEQRQQEQLKQHGLAGKKLGKHKVPEANVDVQLGEDLSESLRALKPEGNLFRDRFLSLQQRALIEPRARVLPKKRRNKMVEYEKHAWKRFQ